MIKTSNDVATLRICFVKDLEQIVRRDEVV